MHDDHHPLHDLLPQTREEDTQRELRSAENVTTITCNKVRTEASALPTAIRLYNEVTYGAVRTYKYK